MNPVRAELTGHLSEAALNDALKRLDVTIDAQRDVNVIIDCMKMTGYDLAARHAFVDWHKRNRQRIHRVAILTPNRMWWVVVSTMSMTSGTPMKAFAEEKEATDWLAEP